MPVKYKIDVLAALKDKGYNTSRIRREKLIGEATIQRLRHNQSVSYDVLGKLCELLGCQVGDILEYVPDDYYTSQNENAGE